MAELAKLALLLTLLVFILPILFYLTFWVLGALASGNVIPFILFLVISLWAISHR
jgi:hypothetical protein